MLTLDQLRERCDSAADADERLCKEYENVRARYEEMGLHLEDSADLMFSNHIMCLLKRIRSGEFIDEIPEELFSEIPDRARQVASDLLAGAFESEGVEPNKTEVLMVATHLGVAMETER